MAAASLVDSQITNISYLGLLNTVIRMARATTTPAAMEIIIVFCLDVYLFHHSNTLAGISFNLSVIVSYPFLNLHIHQFFVAFQELISDCHCILQSGRGLVHGNDKVMGVVYFTHGKFYFFIFRVR